MFWPVQVNGLGSIEKATGQTRVNPDSTYAGPAHCTGQKKETEVSNDMSVSKQWASRPDDQRFLSLEDLMASVQQRKQESWTATPLTSSMRAVVMDGDSLAVQVYDPTHGEVRNLLPTHWGFGQLAQYASAPAAYLRTLPPTLAAINLQYGLEAHPMRDDALVLGQTNGRDSLRAITSVSYGRIWDKQVVQAVMNVNRDGRWVIPAASYTTTNPKRATTLYASDRDVFIFLVDPKNPIEVAGETLYRGFYTWNSEVGSATFGLRTFLYRYVCDNRIVWGVTDVKELRIKHTSGAPERFSYEGARYLNRYANESTQALVDGIKAAKQTEVPLKVDQDVVQWLQERGFTKAQAQASAQTAQAEEGSTRTVWDIVNGVTAYARSVQHTDARIDLETKAGDLMKFAK